MSFQGLRTHLVYLSLRLFKLRLLSMKKYFIIIITIFIYSCERDSSSQSSGEQLIPGRKIYIAGSSYNSSGDMTACYWVDGVRNELSEELGLQILLYQMEMSIFLVQAKITMHAIGLIKKDMICLVKVEKLKL